MAARGSTHDSPTGQGSLRQVAREVSDLQARLLERIHSEMGEERRDEAFAAAAQELARAFGSVSATAIGAVAAGAERPAAEPVPGLHRRGQMRRRLEQLVEMHRRYGHPFALIAIDVEGPGTREEDSAGGRETVLAVVDAALRESIRLVDEAYRLEGNGICVLAPNQTTVGGVQMAERLLELLDDLEDAGGLPIGIAAGVVACPQHGTDAERLLSQADEAMWRAQAVGQPVGVGPLSAVQDR